MNPHGRKERHPACRTVLRTEPNLELEGFVVLKRSFHLLKGAQAYQSLEGKKLQVAAFADRMTAGGALPVPAVYLRVDGRAFEFPVPVCYLAGAVPSGLQKALSDVLHHFRGRAPAAQAVQELRTKTSADLWKSRCQEAHAYRWSA